MMNIWERIGEMWASERRRLPRQGKHSSGSVKPRNWRRKLNAKRKAQRQARKTARNRK